MTIRVQIQLSLCSQTLAEVKLDNTGVKPVMSVAMRQRQQGFLYSVSELHVFHVLTTNLSLCNVCLELVLQRK